MQAEANQSVHAEAPISRPECSRNDVLRERDRVAGSTFSVQSDGDVSTDERTSRAGALKASTFNRVLHRIAPVPGLTMEEEPKEGTNSPTSKRSHSIKHSISSSPKSLGPAPSCVSHSEPARTAGQPTTHSAQPAVEHGSSELAGVLATPPRAEFLRPASQSLSVDHCPTHPTMTYRPVHSADETAARQSPSSAALSSAPDTRATSITVRSPSVSHAARGQSELDVQGRRLHGDNGGAVVVPEEWIPRGEKDPVGRRVSALNSLAQHGTCPPHPDRSVGS